MLLNAERVQCADDALFPVNLMNDENGNDIGEKHQNDNAGDQPDTLIHDDIAGGSLDADIVRIGCEGEKLTAFQLFYKFTKAFVGSRTEMISVGIAFCFLREDFPERLIVFGRHKEKPEGIGVYGRRAEGAEHLVVIRYASEACDTERHAVR